MIAPRQFTKVHAKSGPTDIGVYLAGTTTIRELRLAGFSGVWLRPDHDDQFARRERLHPGGTRRPDLIDISLSYIGAAQKLSCNAGEPSE